MVLIAALGASVTHAWKAALRELSTGNNTCRIGKISHTTAPPPRWLPSGWLSTTESGTTPSRRNEGATRR